MEPDRPSSIDNTSLLQFYNSDSKEFIFPASSKATNAHNIEPTSSDGDASVSDSSTCVMVGSSPSSTSTQNSFVLINSNNQNPDDAETFDNAAGQGQGFNSNLNSSGKNLDERTKRRMKWASKKADSDKPKAQGETTHQQQQSTLNNDVEEDNKANILKEDIQYNRDYYILGDNAWMILSSKFGFDVDIELPLHFDATMGRLKVEGILVFIPEDGSFGFLDQLYAICDNDTQNIVTNEPSESSDEDDLVSDHTRKCWNCELV